MITVDRVMSWEPCGGYARERVVELFAGRDVLTPQEVAVLDIPPQDIVWVLIAWMQACGHDKILHSLTCSFAERALVRERSAGREPDPALWAAIEVKRRWLRGEATDEELDAASAAAWDAARAARNAAWAADEAAARAAWNAARAAAWAANKAAAWAAYEVAAWDAANARDEAARQQIAMILEVLP